MTWLAQNLGKTLLASRQMAAPEVDQWRCGPVQHIDHPPDRDDDPVALDRLLEPAIDRTHGIAQDRRAGGERAPVPDCEALGAFLRALAAEHVGNRRRLARQEIE